MFYKRLTKATNIWLLCYNLNNYQLEEQITAYRNYQNYLKIKICTCSRKDTPPPKGIGRKVSREANGKNKSKNSTIKPSSALSVPSL